MNTSEATVSLFTRTVVVFLALGIAAVILPIFYTLLFGDYVPMWAYPGNVAAFFLGLASGVIVLRVRQAGWNSHG